MYLPSLPNIPPTLLPSYLLGGTLRVFQLFQLFQILSVSVPQFQILFLPFFKKRISACSNPTQTTKKKKGKEEFLSFPFQTIPESLETLDVSEGEKRSFLLGRKTQNWLG